MVEVSLLEVETQCDEAEEMACKGENLGVVRRDGWLEVRQQALIRPCIAAVRRTWLLTVEFDV